MNRKLALLLAASTGALVASANQQPSGNANPAYADSNVQAHLRLNICEDTDTVHFIRDTNDPKIITKTYVLKHADPNSIRPYLRNMVQTLRVDYNNAVGRANTAYYNAYSKAGTAARIFVQTGIECIEFMDGTSVLIVSAEDYRFKDNANGMGIDSLVAALDQPGLVNSSGQPKFIYFPVNRPARELREMIRLVGANMSNDTVELIGGKDRVEVDADLNCLFFNVALYSRKTIEDMLKIYDVAHPEVRVTCTVYELDYENDGMLGIDFQSWKNNDGIKLFSSGAQFSRNYNIRDIVAPVSPDGTVNSHFFNFQPKWNSKFLDFLVSKGRARILTSGDLTIQNGSTGNLERNFGVMYAEATKIAPDTDPPQSGNEIEVKPANDKFKFVMNITPSITEKATTLSVSVATRSMLGYTSKGEVRTSSFESNQKIMIGNGRNRFYLGGIDKVQTVSDVGGVPLLKDIPYLGWLFSTERESTKKSQVVVVAECEIIHPNTGIDDADLEQIRLIRGIADRESGFNHYGFRQFGVDSER